MGNDPMAEFLRCQPLRPPQLQRLLLAGIDSLAIETSDDGTGLGLQRDDVVLDAGRRRFEFARYSRAAWLAEPAIIVLAFDEHAGPLDLVAWRGEQIASWLGRAPMLGWEQLAVARLTEPFPVFRDVLSWLKNDRYGIVPVDFKRAAGLLRDEAHLSVESADHRREIVNAMKPRLPVVEIRQAQMEAAG